MPGRLILKSENRRQSIYANAVFTCSDFRMSGFASLGLAMAAGIGTILAILIIVLMGGPLV